MDIPRLPIIIVYGGPPPPLQDRRLGTQFVTPILENKVFNTRSSRVGWLTAYGVLISSDGTDWPPTVDI